MPQSPPLSLLSSLAPDEKILWSAQPPPYVFMLRGIPNIAYGVTWSVLGAFWYHGSGGIGKYSAFDGWWRLTPLFSLPFILAGFSFFLYPIRLGARARRTWYAITNHRVFIAECPGNREPQLRVFNAAELAATQIRERPAHLADLIFSPSARVNPHLKPRLESGFFGLRDAPQVAKLVGNSRSAPRS